MITEKVEKELYEIFEEHNSESKVTISPEDVIKLIDSIKNKISERSYEGQVFTFMANFKQDINTKPHIPSVEDCKFRLGLLLEELCELAEACGTSTINAFIVMLQNAATKLNDVGKEGKFENTESALDAYGDLLYILFGGVHKFGFGSIFASAFEIIHESNMSKLCSNLEEVEQTIAKYAKDGITVIPEETLHNGTIMYIIKKVADDDSNGKVLKNINYTPADFTRLLYQNAII